MIRSKHIYSRPKLIMRPLAVATMAAVLSSCSMLPFMGKSDKDDDDKKGLLVDDTETSKYGFHRDDKTAEEEILIHRFEQDRSNLDHAITNTKELISKSFGRPFLPELYIRLAELYAEKSRIVFFLRRLEMGERGRMGDVSSVEAKGLKEKAIETYLQIISHFTDFDELDKVHFYLAHEFRELGQYEKMAEQYDKILASFPESEFVPESLLLRGDHAYEKKNIDEALSYYHKVLQYPKSSAIVIARYKLAWVHINKRNYRQALNLFELSVANKDASKTVEVDSYNRVDIRQEALADMAFTYSHVFPDSKPGEDSKYFRDIAWSRQSYMMVMEKLANRYMIKRRWDNAAYIYRELSKMQFDGKKLLEYTENLYTCILESKNFSNSDTDVALIIKALEQNRYSAHTEMEDKQKQLNEYEVYARDVATRIHENAKRTKKAEDFLRAANVYEKFLNFFDNSPKYAEIRINYAESLFSAGNFTKAGKIYEEIASESDDPKIKHDPLYSAAVAYYTALEDPKKLNYYETAYSQDGLRDVGQLYASLYPNSKNVPDILFNIARIKYDQGEFEAAVQEFSAFVKRYPKGKNAQAAVELMMDSLNLTENYIGLIDLQQDLAGVSGLDSSVKQQVAKVGKAAESKIIQEMVVDSINDWDSGKEKLLNLADSAETSGLNIQALNALFVSSQEHGDIETMHAAGQSIASRFPGTEHADKALKSMINLSLETGKYRVVADYLEQYTKQFPKSNESKDFLLQAAQIRANLKQNSLAIDDFNKLMSSFRLEKPERQSAILSLLETYEDKHEKELAYRALARGRNSLDSGIFNTLAAELSYYTNRQSETPKYLRNARRAFKQGRVPKRYSERLGRTSYALTSRSYDQFMKIQMGKKIDNSIVEKKTKLQEKLQEDFIRVINFKSPRWSILACYRLSEVNSEYARFLEDAPLPDGFSAEEVSQYKAIIAEKAQEYKSEAAQYLKTGRDLANKIRPFDRQIANYQTEKSGFASRNTPFSSRVKQKQLGLETLKTPELREVYDALFKNPEDPTLRMKLANAYVEKGDLGQALVITKQLLTEPRKLRSKQRAGVYAMMGSIYMRFSQDQLAREAFEKALEIDKSNYLASVNLAGLYHHYGYKDFANGIYSGRGQKNAGDDLLVFSQAEGFFNAR